MSSNNSTTTLWNDAITFDWDKLQAVPDECYLVALDMQQMSVVLSLLRYAQAQHLWRYSETATWETDVQPWVEELKGAFLMACNINDIVTQLTRIADNLELMGTNPAGGSSNGVLDAMASSAGVSTAWTAIKALLIAEFPGAAIPIAVGSSVIEFLVNNANSSETEVFEIAKMLGSTASLPD